MKSWPEQGGKPGCIAYIVVLIIVAVVIFVVLALVGPATDNIFTSMGNAL